MAMTIEQQRAIAKASARRRAQTGAPKEMAVPAQELIPGSREYADWARSQAMSGKALPRVGDDPNSGELRYNSALEQVRAGQFAGMSDDQWDGYSKMAFPPSNFRDVTQTAQIFGLGDEISSAVGAVGSQMGGGLGFGPAYDQYAELEQARRDVGREQMGTGVALAGDVLGGFTGFAPTRAATFAALPAAVNLSTPAARTGAVVSGALLGGAGGLGTADEDRARAGAVGAGIGTVAGRFGPDLANAASSAYSNVANLLGRNKAAAQAGMSPAAANFASDTLAADDALSAAGLSRMNAAGGEQMLADAGPSAQRMLDTAIQSSGNAGRVAREAIDGRLGRDAQAIQEALDSTLGTPQGIKAARARIAAETAGERGAAYTAADAVPIDYSSEAGYLLDELLTRVPKSAIDRANTLMKIRGEKSSTILADIADDGTVKFIRKPDVRQIDYITRALNEEASDGIGMGAMGGQTTIGSSLQNLSNDIRLTLGNHVPEYRTALDTAGDAIRRSQAVKLGADLLKPSVTMEDVIEQSAGLSPAEQEGLAQGLRQQIDNLLARVKRTIGGGADTEAREAQQALLQLSSRENRTKIAAALGEERAQPLFDELDRAGKSFELSQSVATGSDTFARQNNNTRLTEIVDSQGPVSAVLKGEPLNAGKRIVQALTGKTPAAVARQKDAIAEEVVRLLTAKGPDAARNFQIMQQLVNGKGQNSAVAQALLSNISRASLPTSGVTARYNAARQ